MCFQRPLVAQQLKDLALSLLSSFSSWPRNFHMCLMWPKRKEKNKQKKKMCFLSICDFLHSRYSRKPKYYCNAQWKRWGHCLKPSLVAFTEKTHVFQNRCVPRVLNSGILRWWTNSLVNIASLKSACKTRGTMAWAPYWHLTCGSEGNSPTMWGTIPHTKRIVLQWLS